MSTLKLGAYNLPAAEVALVKTLFRLFSHGKAFRWTFVNAPPYDALIVDGTKPESVSGDVSLMGASVLRLTPMNARSEPNTLQRPIRADKLQAWLNATEQAILKYSGAVFASASHEQELGVPGVSQELPGNGLSGGVRFKLRRWPSALLLRGDPTRIRMATLLSRRALNAQELSVICQQPVGTCEVFIQVMRAANLIETLHDPILQKPQAGQVSPVTGPKARLTRSLISGIRRRLGL